MLEILGSIFANAAAGQKLTLAVLAAAVPATLIAAVMGLTTQAPAWRRLIAAVRIAAPLLGVLVAAMNAFHMAQTIQRLPFDPTAKQLAPGILEISALLGLGALAGLVAALASLIPSRDD
jgi:hypothetical protein